MSEYILLECTRCPASAKKYLPHSMSDTEIMKQYKGWTAKGVYGAKSTKCPNCSGKHGKIRRNNAKPTSMG